VYKTAGLHKHDVDQKITVDLSAIRLERLAPELVHELGPELKEGVDFFKRVRESFLGSWKLLVPLPDSIWLHSTRRGTTIT